MVSKRVCVVCICELFESDFAAADTAIDCSVCV